MQADVLVDAELLHHVIFDVGHDVEADDAYHQGRGGGSRGWGALSPRRTWCPFQPTLDVLHDARGHRVERVIEVEEEAVAAGVLGASSRGEGSAPATRCG